MSKYSGWVQNQIKGLDKILEDCIGYKTDGVFVEVGGFDCKQWSPCWPLALAGWRGLYFEPQIDLYYQCLKNLEKYPNVTVVNKAISNYIGEATLHLGGSLSTLSEETRNLYLDVDEMKSTGLGNDKKINVTVSTLDHELTHLEFPMGFDLLVIDVEGEELHVLEEFSIGVWKPKLVVVEAHEQHWDARMHQKAEPINRYMEIFGYNKIYSDHINNIYCRDSSVGRALP